MKEYLPRTLSAQLARAMDSLPVVVLTGMRQVGKTTLLRKDPLFAARRYVTLDDFGQQQAARSSPELLLDAPEPLTIDEVQKEPALLKAVKPLIDSDRRAGQYLLSGSANLLMLSQVSESLAGRAIYLRLWPMTRRELSQVGEAPFLLRLLEEGTVAEGSSGPPIRAEEVQLGGMPPVVVDGAEPDMWYRGFEQTYLERDIRSLSQVGDLQQFRSLLRLSALRTGGILNVAGLARDADLPPTTTRRYLELLQTSFSLFLVPPYRRNRSQRLVKSSKLYLSDSGLANYLIGSRTDPMGSGDRYAGSLLETYVAINLMAICEAWLPSAELCFWNLQGRYEVDFVVEDGTRTLAIEVKSGTRWSESDLRGLRRFLELTPSCSGAILACNTPQSVKLDERLWAMPISLLLG